jgi:hypothetical protein
VERTEMSGLVKAYPSPHHAPSRSPPPMSIPQSPTHARTPHLCTRPSAASRSGAWLWQNPPQTPSAPRPPPPRRARLPAVGSRSPVGTQWPFLGATLGRGRRCRGAPPSPPAARAPPSGGSCLGSRGVGFGGVGGVGWVGGSKAALNRKAATRDATHTQTQQPPFLPFPSPPPSSPLVDHVAQWLPRGDQEEAAKVVLVRTLRRPHAREHRHLSSSGALPAFAIAIAIRTSAGAGHEAHLQRALEAVPVVGAELGGALWVPLGQQAQGALLIVARDLEMCVCQPGRGHLLGQPTDNQRTLHTYTHRHKHP